jgi:glycosyltransferase involved in cell wall biosynthesis
VEKPRIGVLSVPWTGIPPKSSLGSIANVVHELTRPLADRYRFVLVGGTSRSADREVPGVEYVAIDDAIDRRWSDPAWRAAAAVKGDRRPDAQHEWFHRRYASVAARRLAAAGCDLVLVPEYPQWMPILRRALPRARIAYWAHSGISVLTQGDAFARYVTDADADGAVANSEYVARCIEERAPSLRGRAHVVYNGFDPDRFSPRPEPVPSTTIMSVGRVTPDKGTHVLVDAFRQLAIDRPELRLVIGGPLWITDPDTYTGLALGHEHELAALARPNLPTFRQRVLRRLRRAPAAPLPFRTELERRSGPFRDRVHFVGSLLADDLPAQLRASLVFVQPSMVEEGFPLTSLEAMACGLPLVTSDRGGCPEMVEDGGNGFVVPSGDAGALAAALRKIVDDPARQQHMAACSIELAPRYTWEATAASMAAALDEILAR